jgi:uncharacterized membrane protein
VFPRSPSRRLLNVASACLTLLALLGFSHASAQNEPTPAVPGIIERPAASGSGADFEVRLSSGELVNVVDDLGSARLGQNVQVVQQRLPSGAIIYRLSPGDQPEYVEAVVQRITRPSSDPQQAQFLEVKLNSGKLVAVEDTSARFRPGDRIQVYPTLGPSNEFLFYANDYVRRGGLIWLVAAFVAVAVLIGRAKGLRAVIGMGVSLAVILLLIVPAIVAGWNPVPVAILGSSLILAASVYFVHGINWTAHSSLLATVVTAVLTLLLAYGFSSLTYLTGLGAEEGTFILQMSQAAGITVDLRSLLIAGILIGSLGALVDSTVAQAAVVRELSNLNPKLRWQDLYRSGMGVGFDHIGSLVNTLVLANLGSSLQLWVVFSLGAVGFTQALNLELVASEVVHALVGSIGLILAVPLATLIAAWLFAGGRFPGTDNVHGHAQVYNPQTRTEALIDALQRPLEPKQGSKLKGQLPNLEARDSRDSTD